MTQMTQRLRSKNTISPNSQKLYGNIAVYSPDDVFMFYANDRKMVFYIKNDLVEKIGEKAYRLKFVPKGLGNSAGRGEKIGYPRENRCVVTGNIENLTKHHIVPRFFRVFLPEKFKSNFQTVVMVGRKEHNAYTREEVQFYDVLSEIYGVPNHKTFNTPRKKDNYSKYLADILLKYGTKMPQSRREDLELTFMHTTNMEANFENYVLVSQTDTTEAEIGILTPENHFGCAVVSKVTDFHEFEMLWLNHFIKHTNPKFLPQDLIESYNLNLVD